MIGMKTGINARLVPLTKQPESSTIVHLHNFFPTFSPHILKALMKASELAAKGEFWPEVNPPYVAGTIVII